MLQVKQKAGRLLEIIRDHSMHHQITLVLLVSFLVLTAVYSLILHFFSNGYNQQFYENTLERLNVSADLITERLNEVEGISEEILSSDELQEQLWHDYNQPYRTGNVISYSEIRYLLSRLMYSTNGNFIRSVSIFGKHLHVNNFIDLQELVSVSFGELRTAAAEGNGATAWRTDAENPKWIYLTRTIRRIEKMQLIPMGEEVIQVDLDDIIRSSFGENAFEKNTGLILTLPDGSRCGIGVDSDMNSLLEKEYAADRGTYSILKWMGNSYFVVSGRLKEYGWEYIYYQPYDRVIALTNRIQLLGILFLILGAVAVFAATNYSLQRIVRSVRLFANDLIHWDEKQTDLSGYRSRKDEIGDVYREFEALKKELDHYIETNYLNEILKREAQLKALQLQINPHFLYNTLDSLNWRAELAGDEDMARMIHALAFMLRQTMSEGAEDHTVRKERELVENYLVIQKIRFEERLGYSFCIPKELEEVMIPKFILQPLVENAIEYSLEDSIDTCEIVIRAEKADGVVFLRVENTGSSFPEGLMEQLEDGTFPVRGHGVGLKNIDKRLHYRYGNAYGVKVFNEQGRAVAQIMIPLEQRSETESKKR